MRMCMRMHTCTCVQRDLLEAESTGAQASG